MAKIRYGLLVRVIVAHGLGAVALLALARTVHAVFDLGPWYLAKVFALYALATLLCVRFVGAHHPFAGYGPANVVTMIRGGFAALIAALIGETVAPGAALFAALLSVAITVLDGFDGRLARTSGMSSSFGARFDMETDSALVLAMSILAWQLGKAGPWILAIGLMRYAFSAAGRVLPWLSRPLTPTKRGRTVAVVQMGTLSFVLAPFVSVPFASAAAALALAALIWSFAVDIGRLWRART